MTFKTEFLFHTDKQDIYLSYLLLLIYVYENYLPIQDGIDDKYNGSVKTYRNRDESAFLSFSVKQIIF